MSTDPKHDHDSEPCSRGDELAPGPVLQDGSQAFIRHTADHQLVAGTMRPIKEGQPLLPGSVFKLHPREKSEWCGVEEIFRIEAPPCGQEDGSSQEAECHDGPAKVNTESYRQGWDRIFGKPVIGQA